MMYLLGFKHTDIKKEHTMDSPIPITQPEQPSPKATLAFLYFHTLTLNLPANYFEASSENPIISPKDILMCPSFIAVVSLVFDTGLCYIAQAGLELTILLP